MAARSDGGITDIKYLLSIPGAKKIDESQLLHVKPMLATLIDKPFDSNGWVYEIKWDGYRVIAEIKDNSVNIYSRNENSFNKKFASIVSSLEKMKLGDVVLDGEVAALDEKGRSSFSLLQEYIKTGRAAVVYYVFDLLRLIGCDLTGVELAKRKEILKELVRGNESVLSGQVNNIMVSDYIEETGIDFFNIALKNDLEGIVAKKKDSIYEPGIRSANWLKIKIRHTQEAVICGYIESEEGTSPIKSLVTGVLKNGQLVFSGLVSGGLDQKEKDFIFVKLDEIRTSKCPFKIVPKLKTAVQWVRPFYVMQVEFTEWTEDGLFRQPVYLGLRIDKSADEAVFEKEISVKSVSLFKKGEAGNTEMHIKPRNKKKNAGSQIKAETGSGAEILQYYGIELTNPDKIFWPEEKITKKDLFEYYKKISPYILPYISGRLQSLNRCPDGIHGECFYQKDIDYILPETLQTKKIYSDSRHEFIDYLICNGPTALLYMVNLGCIDIHPWSSRVENIEKPDFAILDLDPLDVAFNDVINVALQVKDVLDSAAVPGFCKTSGSKGIHIYIPLDARYSYGQALDFIKVIALIVNKKMPGITSLERHPDKRHNKVYLDCYQNKFGATVAAPYCLRPKKGAPVSTPLRWRELQDGLDPHDFNIKSIFSRLEKTGDIWKGTMGPPVDMVYSVQKLRSIL